MTATIQPSALHSLRSFSSMRPFSILLLALLLSLSTTASIQAEESWKTAIRPARECGHDGGLWGTAKNSIIEPIMNHSVRAKIEAKYNGLDDKGRFLAGACAGFGASRLAVRTTVKTVKTVGAAYIVFEALEYAGVLKDARSGKNKQLLAQSRDYLLRTVDGIRHDVRTQLKPSKMSQRFKRGMAKDKAGTVGFGTGAFLGFAL